MNITQHPETKTPTQPEAQKQGGAKMTQQQNHPHQELRERANTLMERL